MMRKMEVAFHGMLREILSKGVTFKLRSENEGKPIMQRAWERPSGRTSTTEILR